MTPLLDRAFPRTLATLVGRLLAAPPAGPVEAWLFEHAGARRAAEARLARGGVRATLRSAYKPLLCHFTEAVDRAGLARVAIRYPVHPQAHPDRFLAEAYPLAALLDGIAVTLRPGGPDLAYQVDLTRANGGVSAFAVRAPNRPRAGVLACCGWLLMPGTDAALPTEFEALYDAALETVRAQSWPETGPPPYFGRLTLRLDLPCEDTALGWGDEALSPREAMHEDLLYSLREALCGRQGVVDEHDAQPGQIVPDIRAGAPRARITVSAFGPPPAEAKGAEDVPVAEAERPPGLAQIGAEVDRLGGHRFAGRTAAGRPVPGTYRAGPGEAVLITAGQHGNETSGPVGALRAARALADDAQAHFAVVPVENADGYALHQCLAAHNPRHMHHAARYTARGEDVSARTDPGLARQQALALCGARLHVNLHGYPAHEWTRPLSGYLPRGFEAWTLPRGFFLILAHDPGWRARALRLLRHVAAAVAADPALLALNARQVAAARAHAGVPAATATVHGIDCFVSESAGREPPVMLMTEAPDETVYGPEFVLLHSAQTRAALAAARAWRTRADDGMTGGC